jgi:DNA-binding beta-propeller fold protein YncE
MSHSVCVIDLVSRSVPTTIQLPGAPITAAMVSHLDMALIPLEDANSVAIIDLPSLTAAPLMMPVGKVPYDVAVTPNQTLALVANLDDNTVSVL